MEIAAEHVVQPDYDFVDKFEIGLNVVLDALEGWLTGPRRRPLRCRRINLPQIFPQQCLSGAVPFDALVEGCIRRPHNEGEEP